MPVFRTHSEQLEGPTGGAGWFEVLYPVANDRSDDRCIAAAGCDECLQWAVRRHGPDQLSIDFANTAFCAFLPKLPVFVKREA